MLALDVGGSIRFSRQECTRAYRTSPIHSNRSMYHPLHCLFGNRQLRVIRKHDLCMEVTVPNMANDRSDQTESAEVFLGLIHEIRQS